MQDWRGQSQVSHIKRPLLGDLPDLALDLHQSISPLALGTAASTHEKQIF